MVDNELIVQDVPYDQISDPLDVAEYLQPYQDITFYNSNLIEFVFTAQGLVLDGTAGWYLIVEEASALVNPSWDELMRVGIGAHAMLVKGMKFALPSNSNRVIRFRLEGSFTGGTFTVKAVGLRP